MLPSFAKLIFEASTKILFPRLTRAHGSRATAYDLFLVLYGPNCLACAQGHTEYEGVHLPNNPSPIPTHGQLVNWPSTSALKSQRLDLTPQPLFQIYGTVRQESPSNAFKEHSFSPLNLTTVKALFGIEGFQRKSKGIDFLGMFSLLVV